jgi:uncharacterized protein DUF4381
VSRPFHPRRPGWLVVVALVLVAGPPARAATAPGDTLDAPCRLSKVDVGIGERVHVRVALPKPDPDAHLVGPVPNAFGAIQVLTSQESVARGDSTAWEMDIALFDLGERSLSALPLRLEGKDKTVPVALRDCVIRVAGTLPDTATAASLRDVKGPLPVPFRWRWGRIALALGILAALIAFLVWMRKRRRAPAAIPIVEVPGLTPEEAALRALRELEDAALAARGRRPEHYVRLSGILREYVEKRFRVPAVESTTTELRHTFLRASRTPVESDALLELLDASDLVKFARYDPGPETARADLDRARAWIERNRPAELPLPEEAVHAAG